MEKNIIKSLGDAERIVSFQFAEAFENYGYLNLSKVGKVVFNKRFQLMPFELLANHIKSIIAFVAQQYNITLQSPIWYKLNVHDNISPELVGIGYLNPRGNWLSFAEVYLQTDQALEGGVCLITILDQNINWAIIFQILLIMK